ncbi:MAG: hypothetical protein PVI91_04785 [Gammaproteobacteria bacterium]|jgi:hypothetical protein
MTQGHQEIAGDIVEQFRAGLSGGARQHIDSEHFMRLEALIREALTAEQTVAVDLVEELLVRLRTRLDTPQLEL